MTRFLKSITTIFDAFDVAVLDQWGVLHDGTQPYRHAIEAMNRLATAGKKIIVVSNSGKRSALNLGRISKLGLPTQHVSEIVTSGEALWEDLHSDRIQIGDKTPHRFFPICGKPNDSAEWAGKSPCISFTQKLDRDTDAILLMGLADGTKADAFDETLEKARQLEIPLICSNPDKASPRADRLVTSPGALADRFAEFGGTVIWYGKPHANIYHAVLRHCPNIQPNRFLMIGDSLEHDIGGAEKMGFQSALIRNGIHASQFADCRDEKSHRHILKELAREKGVSEPGFFLSFFA